MKHYLGGNALKGSQCLNVFRDIYERRCKRNILLAKVGPPSWLNWYSQGNFMVCGVRFAGYPTVVGVSKRHSGDKMRVFQGMRLAYARALDNFILGVEGDAGV